MDNFEKIEEKVLNVSDINSPKAFQKYLKKELEFPDFYGMNWDAFWDAITGLVELPEKLIIVGWENLSIILPEEAKSFCDLLEQYNREYPMCKCEISYT